MSIFGQSYNYKDDLFVITDDLDMEGNRIIYLKSPAGTNDAVNKKYVNKRIEYKAKYLDNKIASFKAKLDKESDDTL